MLSLIRTDITNIFTRILFKLRSVLVFHTFDFVYRLVFTFQIVSHVLWCFVIYFYFIFGAFFIPLGYFKCRS